MKSAFCESEKHECIFVRSVGPVSARGWRNLIEAIMAGPMYMSGAPILHDLRSVDFSGDTVDMLATGRTPVKDAGPTVKRTVAMVTGSDLGFAMAGIVARLRSRQNHQTLMFRTIAEAADAINRPACRMGFPGPIATALAKRLIQISEKSDIALSVDEPSG